MEKVTRKDVAKRANVSEQTVSYVINNTRKFSKEIVDRVNRAIIELNYIPNAAARALSTKTSYELSIIVHDIRNPIFNDIMSGFQEAAAQKNYFVTVVEGSESMDDRVKHFISRNFAGIFLFVLIDYQSFDFIPKLVNAGIKVVTDSVIEDPSIQPYVSSVAINHYDGMSQIIDYLTKLGHEDIVYLSSVSKDKYFDKRYSGFIDAYKQKYHKEPFTLYSKRGNQTDIDLGRNLTKELIKSEKKFTAIVTTNDLMAYAAIETLEKHGYRVPEDVSIVGIDDLFFSHFGNPKLTSLGFDKIHYGRKAFESLYNQIHNNKKTNQLIDMEIIVRDTTAPANK